MGAMVSYWERRREEGEKAKDNKKEQIISLLTALLPLFDGYDRLSWNDKNSIIYRLNEIKKKIEEN